MYRGKRKKHFKEQIFNTEKRSAYRGHNGERPQRVKHSDNLYNEGGMNFDTDKSSAYRGKRGEKARNAKHRDANKYKAVQSSVEQCNAE